jgi:multiple sugar transport system substrate-binding protein
MPPVGSPDMSPSGSPDGSPGEGSAIEPPATAVSIDFWTPFTGADGDTMEELVTQFNEEAENVEVAIQRLPEYYTQINNAAAAGEIPHVMIMHIDQLALQAANNTVQPVTELSSQLGLSADDFTGAVWEGSMWQGEQFSIPLDIHPATLYYNKALLTEAGLDPESPPTDQESFEAALQACNDAGITGPTWSNHFFSASLFWASLFYQGGGEWTNEDYSQATFNSEAGVNATNYMVGLVEEGLHPADAAADTEVSSFESGASCMAITGIWQTNRFQEALGENFGAAPIPQIFGEGVWAGSHTLAIREGLEGDELQGAYFFIDWLTNHTLEWAAGGQIPARVDVREDPAFAEIPDVPDIAEQVEAAQFPPPIPGSADLLGGPGGVTETLLLALTDTGTDVQASLDTAAATYSQILQESKEQYGF